LKTFTIALCIEKPVVVPIPRRPLFTMVKNSDFFGSLDTNPYRFQHYDINDFSPFGNGKLFPNEGLSPDLDYDKTSVMGSRTLYEASGIRHS